MNMDYTEKQYQETSTFINSCDVLQLDYDTYIYFNISHLQNDVRTFLDKLFEKINDFCYEYELNPFFDNYFKGEAIDVTKTKYYIYYNSCEHTAIKQQAMYCIDIPMESILILFRCKNIKRKFR